MKYSSLFFIFILIVFKSFSQNSILSEGQWFKLGIIESGVYKVDRSFFNSNNIDINNIDPNKIQLFGSGYNGYLPQLNSESNYFEPKKLKSNFLEMKILILTMVNIFIFIFNHQIKFIMIHQIMRLHL